VATAATRGVGLRGCAWAAAIAALLALAGCGGSAGRSYPGSVGDVAASGGLECVPYARQVSGIDIRGDAWTWWSEAAGRYQRGEAPEAGAVLVMQATRVMRRGHLAVVEAVTAPREIRVTQANWGYDRKTRGRVETGTPVIDVSEDNSWSAVRVWNRQTQAYGRVNPTYGFIYPRPESLISAKTATAKQIAFCLPPQLEPRTQ
jgi:hypothetical protein